MKKGYQYQLDNKDQDQSFLEGKSIRCKAAIAEKEIDTLNENNRIVILLSNGKKYMGKVNKFDYKIIQDRAEGYLDIERFPALKIPM
jgi:hypothetical protein